LFPLIYLQVTEILLFPGLLLFQFILGLRTVYTLFPEELISAHMGVREFPALLYQNGERQSGKSKGHQDYSS